MVGHDPSLKAPVTSYLLINRGKLADQESHNSSFSMRTFAQLTAAILIYITSPHATPGYNVKEHQYRAKVAEGKTPTWMAAMHTSLVGFHFALSVIYFFQTDSLALRGAPGNISEHHTSKSSWLISTTVL